VTGPFFYWYQWTWVQTQFDADRLGYGAVRTTKPIDRTRSARPQNSGKESLCPTQIDWTAIAVFLSYSSCHRDRIIRGALEIGPGSDQIDDGGWRSSSDWITWFLGRR